MDAATAATPRTSTLRAWQSDALEAMRTWESGPFLISAAPGAGKTRPALVFAREQLRSGAAKRVVVVAPTTPLTRQWADAAGALGVHLAPDSEHLRPPRDFDGVSVTYARVASVAERWSKECGPGDARHRRRGASPRRRALVGSRLQDRLRERAPLAAAVGHAVSQRRKPDPGRRLRRTWRRDARRHVHVRRRGA